MNYQHYYTYQYVLLCVYFSIFAFYSLHGIMMTLDFKNLSILEIMLYLIMGCVVGHVWCSSLLLAAVIEH